MTETTVFLTHNYPAPVEAVFGALKDGTIFRLTGATDVTLDFQPGGLFRLDFGSRDGKNCYIYGSFVEIDSGKQTIFTWNVEGFRTVPDIDTVVTVTLQNTDASTILSLKHERIMTVESFEGKKQGWAEILVELESYFAK